MKTQSTYHMPTTPIIDRRGVSVHLHSGILHTTPMDCTVPASQVSQASGSMMPIRIGSCQHQSFKCRAPFYLFREKRQRHWQSIQQPATALARWSAGSSSHLRKLPPSNAVLFPRLGFNWASGELMAAQHPTPHCVAHPYPQDIAKIL